MTTSEKTPVHEAVQKYYGDIARQSSSCCSQSSSSQQSSSCCCEAPVKSEPVNQLYSRELLAGIPEEIARSTNGSGDPISLAQLKTGETVLDLGSGTGLDAILAARLVGETGHVIGVDMTPEMLERARNYVNQLGLSNVDFREGLLEALPVEDNSIDLVISNCVINLSPDKLQVLKEVFRVLKPGGRIAISDTVANHPITDAMRENQSHWCACTSGALTVSDYMDKLSKAGFKHIALEPDKEVIAKTIRQRNGQLQDSEEINQVLREIDHLDTIKALIVAPYQITAIKPK